MFLRRYDRRKNGKPHTYWALVESFRTAKGSRQRVVAYLGELAAEGVLEFGDVDPAVADRRERVVMAQVADHVGDAPQRERRDQHDEEGAGEPGVEEGAEGGEHG